MPRHYRRKRRYRRRKKPSLAMKAYRIAKSLKSNQELKYFDYEATFDDVDTQGDLIDDLFEPTQGLEDNDRIGDKVMIKSLTVHLRAVQATDSNVHMRFIMFLDKMNTIQAVDSILEPLQVGVNALQPLRQYNIDKRAEFRVLIDKHFILNDVSQEVIFSKIFKRVNTLVKFNNSGIGINTGQYKFMLISNIADGALVKPNFFITTRLRYVDS